MRMHIYAVEILETNAKERDAQLLLFSCRSCEAFCGRDLLKSDNEARKMREVTSHQDANSLEQQVASVPDVRGGAIRLSDYISIWILYI